MGRETIWKHSYYQIIYVNFGINLLDMFNFECCPNSGQANTLVIKTSLFRGSSSYFVRQKNVLDTPSPLLQIFQENIFLYDLLQHFRPFFSKNRMTSTEDRSPKRQACRIQMTF